jgi:polyisoprenoid-binding protein YceI
MALLLVLLSPPVLAAGQCYSVDEAHGRVGFEVDQAGSPFSGTFHRFGGELCLSGDQVTRIDVHLDPGSVDTGLPALDAALLGEEFFAVADHPQARFASERIDRAGERLVAHGTLTLKGVSRPMDVAFVLSHTGDGYTVSGALVFERLDFRVGTGEWANTEWLGGSVRVAYEAHLNAKPGGG